MAWNRSDNTQVKTRNDRSADWRKITVIALAFLVLLAVIAYFLLPTGSQENVEKTSRRGLIANVGTNVVKHVVTNCTVKVPEKVDPLNQKFGKLPDGRWTVPGRKKIHNIVTNTSNADIEAPYNNGPEQIIYSIFSRRLGDMPLPLPTMSAKDRARLAEILMDKVPSSPDDSEELKEGREIIQQAKDELKKYIREGGDPDTFFEYYHNELSRAFEERKLAMKMVFDSAKEEDPEISEEFCKKVNQRLEEKGIKPVAYPRKLVEMRKEQSK